MSTIGDLLQRDLSRKIEEIIQVDQADAQSVHDEITEYVATEKIKDQYHTLLRAIAEAPAEPHEGIGVWGVDWPVVWGFAIINYVWWIAIASGGTFISALFYLMRVEWRTSINRIAESMTLFAAVTPGEPVFGEVLTKHFGDVPDDATLARL